MGRFESIAANLEGKPLYCNGEGNDESRCSPMNSTYGWAFLSICDD